MTADQMKNLSVWTTIAAPQKQITQKSQYYGLSLAFYLLCGCVLANKPSMENRNPPFIENEQSTLGM